jgi:hypothetical protein
MGLVMLIITRHVHYVWVSFKEFYLLWVANTTAL